MDGTSLHSALPEQAVHKEQGLRLSEIRVYVLPIPRQLTYEGSPIHLPINASNDIEGQKQEPPFPVKAED